MALTVTAFAASAPRLFDGAELLSASEEEALKARLDEVSETYQVEIAIATVDTTEGLSVDAFVEHYYDTNGFGYGENHDGVLLLISMEGRDYRILSNGLGATAITSGEIDAIGDLIVSSLSAGDYAGAFHDFIDECEYQIDGEINGFPFEFMKNLVIALVIGFVVAFVVTGAMKRQLKSVAKRLTATEYTKPGSLNVVNAREFFLYRTIDRVKRETKSSGGSSGSSRNVGGGKF